MKLKKWEIALLAALAVTLLSGFALEGEQEALAGKMIRLHVVANSDSDDDQALKLCVRDRILQEMTDLLEGAGSKQEARQILEENLNDVESAAQAEVYDRGYDYPVAVTLAEETFPTREYDTFALPAGEYTSLRVSIGAATGKNWWCVLFPPLCTSAALDGDTAAMDLTQNEKDLITRDGPEYVVKFKALEILARIKEFFQ